MDAAPQPNSVPASLQPPRPDVLNAWPPSAQWATAFLLGVTATLLVVQGLSYLRWGARPSELRQESGPGYHVDLNRAEYAELVQLPGIGNALAHRIIKHREENGPFGRVEDLRQVTGIGPAILERLRPWVRVKEAGSEHAQEREPTPASDRLVPVRMTTLTRDESTRRPVSKKEENLKGVIDLNRATVDELQRLPGIGPKLSQRILDERARRPFQTVEDLRRVPGIGPKTLERLRPHVTVGSDPQRIASAG